MRNVGAFFATIDVEARRSRNHELKNKNNTVVNMELRPKVAEKGKEKTKAKQE